MTRDEARGQSALANLDKYVEPQSIWIGGGATKLYKAEERRTNYITHCAEEWAKVAGVDKKAYWTQSLPQALHDMLEGFQAECGIIAAEAFLKRHGWKIERPKLEE